MVDATPVLDRRAPPTEELRPLLEYLYEHDPLTQYFKEKFSPEEVEKDKQSYLKAKLDDLRRYEPEALKEYKKYLETKAQEYKEQEQQQNIFVKQNKTSSRYRNIQVKNVLIQEPLMLMLFNLLIHAPIT
jgi:hypothetical protein